MSVRSAADWQALATELQGEFHRHLVQFLSIDSVEDMTTSAEGKPFGEGVAQALDYLLQMAEKDGFATRNLDGFAGVVEYGEGQETVGVLVHVDVVPPGDGWTHPPFQPYVHNGRIYARGAVDDKGPALAAYFALKAVRESGLPLAKKIQFIIGTDEESGWLCVKHYGEKETFPETGFSPDSEYPIVHAEKGQVNPTLELQVQPEEKSPLHSLLLKSFQAGTRVNMVPDTAEAIVFFPRQLQKGEETKEQDGKLLAERMKSDFAEFLNACQLEGNTQSEDADCLLLRLKGIASHGAAPDHGKNAGTLLAVFLNGYSEWTARSKSFLQFAADILHEDHFGERFGVACEDEVTGKLTLNPGILDYSADGHAVVKLTLRYPATASQEQLVECVRTQAAHFGWILSELRTSNAHHVPKDHAAVETLQKVYQEHTGQEAELLFSGGATYARCMKYGVAFGPLFPGREDTAHQKDEYMLLDDLVKSIGIYAQALYELCKGVR